MCFRELINRSIGKGPGRLTYSQGCTIDTSEVLILPLILKSETIHMLLSPFCWLNICNVQITLLGTMGNREEESTQFLLVRSISLLGKL